MQQKQTQNRQFKVFSEERDKLLAQYYNEGDKERAIFYMKFCKYNSTTPELSVLGRTSASLSTNVMWSCKDQPWFFKNHHGPI